MKKHSKVGNKPGRPAYRTPSRFIANKSIKNDLQAMRLKLAKKRYS
jgi:hypothetical protein